MRAVVKKKNNALHPVDDRSLHFISRIPEGKDVLVEINSRPRNLRHLRLYWAIVRFLQENVFEHKDKEIIHLAIKKATGLVYMFRDVDTGDILFGEKSISFENMDQDRFDQFFDSAVKTIAERWMAPGTTEESVRQELYAMVDG